MRIAYVASHVPRRHELASGPIDAEWVADAIGTTEAVVFVDYESEGTDLLAEAGVTVSVSPKRPMLDAEGSHESAEQSQARILLAMHLESPFDAIIYDSSQTTDWAWYQARLASVPRGIALGAGAARDIRIVAASPALFATHGRKLWALTGALASADFLVSDVDPAGYGFDAADHPPCYSVGDIPAPRPPTGKAGMIAVVALSEDPAGLASVFNRTLEQVPIDDSTVIALVHPDISTGPETTRDILLSGVATPFRDRVRLAEPSSDGVAAGLLSQADVIVAARPSDLAVRAVADAAARRSCVLLSDADKPAARLTEAALEKLPHQAPRLVAVDRPLADLIPLLDSIADEASAIVLHAPEAAAIAQRLWKLPGAARSGLVLVCDAGRYLGEPDPARPAAGILGFGTGTWPSVRRLLEACDHLHEVVAAAASLANADRVNLLAVPILGVGQGRLGSDTPSQPAWLTDTGWLPAIRFSGTESVAAEPGVYGHSATEAALKHWAETHGVRDRIRLALPWKWGLLDRAMRDRW
ncbi:MAG: hypothetical protein OEP52_08920 [Acidimicrobiia bacterium]|nr:hypothetical protein [Acidimicrobiia bacterium]